MPQVLLGLGSNINPRQRLNSALAALEQEFADLAQSPWFESHALRGGANYLNLVVKAETRMSIEELLCCLHRIEDANGRERGNEASGCALDIDLLSYDQLQVSTDEYQLPRSDLLEHAHVLWPLAELCPDLQHPRIAKGYAQLWQERKASLLKQQHLWQI